MEKKDIRTLQTQAAWSDRSLISFFASTGFTLAPDQTIERDTSSLSEDVAEVARLKWTASGRSKAMPAALL